MVTGGTVGTEPVGGFDKSEAVTLGGAWGGGGINVRPGSGDVVAMEVMVPVAGFKGGDESGPLGGLLANGVVVVTGERMTGGIGDVGALGSTGFGAKIERESRLA